MEENIDPVWRGDEDDDDEARTVEVEDEQPGADPLGSDSE